MDASSQNEITLLLHRLKNGDREAEVQLVEIIYPELRRRARRIFAAEHGVQTLSPTALVHEAYIRLASGEQHAWNDRNHFFAVASIVMRRILVDLARRRQARNRLPSVICIDDGGRTTEQQVANILAVDEALRSLEQVDGRQARVAELRFFGGLSEEETARALNLSERTVQRDWKMAKAWLRTVLSNYADSAGG